MNRRRHAAPRKRKPAAARMIPQRQLRAGAALYAPPERVAAAADAVAAKPEERK